MGAGDTGIDELVADALAVKVVACASVSGGDMASSHRVELADGRTVFAKTHHDPPSGFFTTEARGLGWLRSTGTVAVPEVLVASDQPPLLVLGWVDETRSVRPDEAAFGRALAAMHRSTRHGIDSFGRPDGRTTGSLGLPNDPCSSWPVFLAARRLEPLMRLAHDRHSLPASTIQRLDALVRRIDEVVPADEPVALLHGDLWAGNRIVDAAGHSWLIDPACFGGHREFDLAMMRLFGGYGDAVFAAYHEAHPLAHGWRERVPLHQLPPLIVHAIKFGGPYGAAVDRALGQY